MPNQSRPPDEVMWLIEKAFPDRDPPGPDDLVSDGLHVRDAYAAAEIRQFMLGRHWKSLTSEEMAHHPDWLVYLTPAAFVYYLPAWLTYAMDYMNADYPAQFVLGYLTHPLPDFRDQLSPAQRIALRKWYNWMGSEYPAEDIPEAPEYTQAL